MQPWQKQFRVDPRPTLLSIKNEAIRYFTTRDLLNKPVEPITTLWELPAAQRLLRRQQPDGSWPYPGGGKEHLKAHENYNLIETYRIFSELIEKYGYTNKHKAIQHAADYIFSTQTDEGDFRGIYGTQYMTTYHSGLLELLIKAGYHSDKHITNAFSWLASQRQEDGGWAIPLRTKKLRYYDAIKLTTPLQSDRTKPFSHLITGMALRAYAAHPHYRTTPQARCASELIISRFFKRDAYIDRQTPEYWYRFSYPFWFTDLLSSLDSISMMGYTQKHPTIRQALDWFITKQQDNGLFSVKLVRGKDKDLPSWISFIICRVFKRLYK